MKRMLFALALVALAVPFAALAANPSGSEGTSPAQACRAEQASMGTDAFKALYGTNADKSNAFGKCVSSKAKESNDTADATVLNAVKSCRTERSGDPAAFKVKYGKNRNRANAFGKCVSQRAKANAQQPATP